MTSIKNVVEKRPLPKTYLTKNQFPTGSRFIRSVQELSVIPGLVVLIIVGYFVSPVFLRLSNISLVLQQSSELALIVLGLSLIILTGRLDISLESTVGLAPMVAAMLMVSFHGWGTEINGPTGLLVTVGIGALVGLLNGILVVKLKLDSFIVTLAVLILLRGITTGLSRGQTLAGLPASYNWLGSASLAEIPVSVWVSVSLIVLVGLLLKFHSWGRALYAIGGNENAARATGIPVDRILISVFVIASTLAAVGGVMLAGRLSAVTAGAGSNMIFSALAATVIGGIALAGGQGRMMGAALGVLLLGTLTNVLTLAGVSTFWIDAVYGAVIIGALLAGRFTPKSKAILA